MRRTLRAFFTRKRLIIHLPLVVCLLIGQASSAQRDEKTTGLNTPCAAVRALESGQCMSSYVYQGETYVLCNGPYSLCTTANCTPVAHDPAKSICACDVVQTGLSIRTALANQGATSAISNFSFAQPDLVQKTCPYAQLVNCLNVSCTVSTTDHTTSSCTCPTSTSKPPSGQIILETEGTKVSCNDLRSGAPNNCMTVQLNNALQAAITCTQCQDCQ